MQPLKTICALGFLALTLSGCADNALNGGYNGEAPMRMASIPAPATASSQARPDSVATAIRNEAAVSYVYRGGRDPVTGQATLQQ